ncbi:MAG: nitroreductase family protein [Spirochaetia bacterium]
MSSAYSTKVFTTSPVDPNDLELILQCGVRAPSARNSQPWHFTVIEYLQTMTRIIPDTLKGNILIVRPRTCAWPPNPWAWVLISIRSQLRISMRNLRTLSEFRLAISASQS